MQFEKKSTLSSYTYIQQIPLDLSSRKLLVTPTPSLPPIKSQPIAHRTFPIPVPGISAILSLSMNACISPEAASNSLVQTSHPTIPRDDPWTLKFGINSVDRFSSTLAYGAGGSVKGAAENTTDDLFKGLTGAREDGPAALGVAGAGSRWRVLAERYPGCGSAFVGS